MSVLIMAKVVLLIRMGWHNHIYNYGKHLSQSRESGKSFPFVLLSGEKEIIMRGLV